MPPSAPAPALAPPSPFSPFPLSPRTHATHPCPCPPAGSTFLVFADYMRAAMRVAALSELPVSYILTHDSVGVGEDGPTHQPVEVPQYTTAPPLPSPGLATAHKSHIHTLFLCPSRPFLHHWCVSCYPRV